MRRGLIAVAALTLLVAGMTAASAQGRRGMGGRFGGGLMLLSGKDVQEELKMTQPQIDKLATKQQEVQTSMRELFQNGGGQNASPEDRQKMMAKVQEMQTKAVADILDTKQMKRFHQLELQRQGGSAILRPEVAAELKLTDEQKKKAEEIQQAQQEKTREIFQNAGQGGDRQAMMQQMQELQKAANEKFLGVLTDSQKSEWKAMQGEPFKFAPPQPRQGAAPPPK